MISDTPEILLFQMLYDNIVYYSFKVKSTIQDIHRGHGRRVNDVQACLT